MGVILLQFFEGKLVLLLGFDGIEVFDIIGIDVFNDGKIFKMVCVQVIKGDGVMIEFDVVVCIDIFGEVDYYCNGGILQYVLCNILKLG